MSSPIRPMAMPPVFLRPDPDRPSRAQEAVHFATGVAEVVLDVVTDNPLIDGAAHVTSAVGDAASVVGDVLNGLG